MRHAKQWSALSFGCEAEAELELVNDIGDAVSVFVLHCFLLVVTDLDFSWNVLLRGFDATEPPSGRGLARNIHSPHRGSDLS